MTNLGLIGGLIGVDLAVNPGKFGVEDNQKLMGGGGRKEEGGNWALIWEPIKADCGQS
jgi:hypothetical protein